MYKKILLFLMLGVFAYACAKVPLTGRRQLAAIPNSEILPMSFEQYNQVKQGERLVTNTEQGQMVVRVGNRMAKAVEQYLIEQGFENELKGFEWEFHLIESDQINAWCMPGGKVAFYTGILPICRDEAGVAVVMGHEIAHAVASHGRERMSNALAINGLVGGISVAMGERPNLTQNLFLQSVGYAGELGMLRFSRRHELEADKLGLTFMALAGYDPREAPVFWERMDQATASGGRPPEFLSTHPGPDRRIDQLNKEMSKAMEYYTRSQQ
ncbi:MAG: M48 family metallopeptidase [Nitritalea sp.]